MSDQDIVKLIKALLAKARATPYPAEAEAYEAKAMDLAIKHHVDQSQLADEDSMVVREIVPLKAPWLLHKRNLIHHIAMAMGVYDVASWQSSGGRRPYDQVELFGTPAAIERVAMLVYLLLIQADSAVVGIESVPEGHAGGLKSYRTSWLHGWVDRVGERLSEAIQTHVANAPESVREQMRELLADAMELAHDYHPSVHNPRAREVDPLAYRSGSEAADGADIGQRRFSGPQRALPC